eukprot:26398-Pelagococcus_subviridis.AAC.1
MILIAALEPAARPLKAIFSPTSLSIRTAVRCRPIWAGSCLSPREVEIYLPVVAPTHVLARGTRAASRVPISAHPQRTRASFLASPSGRRRRAR